MIQPIDWDAIQQMGQQEAYRNGLRGDDVIGYAMGTTVGRISMLCDQLVAASNRQEATLNAIRAALEHREAVPPSIPPATDG